MRIATHNLKIVLIDNPPTLETDVKVIPSFDRLDLIPLLVAWIEAVVGGRVSAQANPAILNARL